MDRPGFLKACAMLLAGSAVAKPALAATVAVEAKPAADPSRHRQFRGTSDGRILVSENQGAAWTQHTNLGSAYRILGFGREEGTVTARVAHHGAGEFTLRLDATGRHWIS